MSTYCKLANVKTYLSPEFPILFSPQTSFHSCCSQWCLGAVRAVRQSRGLLVSQGPQALKAPWETLGIQAGLAHRDTLDPQAFRVSLG